MTYPPIPQPMLETVVVPDDDTPPVPTVELRGKRFPIRDEGVPLGSMIELALMVKRQQAGDQTAVMDMLVILHELLQSIITAEAWGAFWAHVKASHADNDDLQSVIEQTTEARARRPTSPSSGSPGGRPTTGTNSAGGSSAPGSSIRVGDPRVQADLEARGRPDLALVVQRAREASTPS